MSDKIKSIIVQTRRFGVVDSTLTVEYKFVVEFGEGIGETYRIKTKEDIYFIPYSEVVMLRVKLEGEL